MWALYNQGFSDTVFYEFYGAVKGRRCMWIFFINFNFNTLNVLDAAFRNRFTQLHEPA